MTLLEQPLVQAILSRWFQLSARDRVIATTLVAAVVVVVLILTVWVPAEAGIDQLNRELTGLRAEHAQLQEMAQEAHRLKGAESHDIAIGAPERVAAVNRTIERSGLSGPPAPEVALDETGAVVVHFADVDYAGWIAWIGRAEGELGASAAKVGVSELPASSGAGHVRAEVTLRWAEKKTPSSTAGTQ